MITPKRLGWWILTVLLALAALLALTLTAFVPNFRETRPVYQNF